MGLIKAALGSAGGALADQWKDYFYCDALPREVLAVRGRKRTGKRSSNRKGSDSVITDGSVIAVADGQCMMIVEQGKVTEVCAEPGEYTFDSELAPSLFCGDLGEGVRRTFEEIGKRFAFGGEAPVDQRIYYFNTKEIVGNKYGTPVPVPFRVVDKNIGLDIDISVRCNGEYSYRIADPILFYTNVCGNFEEEYLRSSLESMQKSELLTALGPAFARLSEKGIRYSALPGHTQEIGEALNEVLSAKWKDMRGIVLTSIGINSVSASKEDEEMLKQLQKSAILRDPTMAAANLAGAHGDAMRMAASNPSGAMNGFFGMNLAGQSTGSDLASMYRMGQQQKEKEEQLWPDAAAGEGAWKCVCGTMNTGKFCTECGKPRQEAGWRCACGAWNTGKFCSQCGQKRPAGVPIYQCDKCGWRPEDPCHPPKFCPECGDPFGEEDQRS